MALSFVIDRRLEAEERYRDPLSFFRCMSEGQEQVAVHFVDGLDVYAHAAERSGKSKIGAALTAAFTLGRDTLAKRDGSIVRLPVLKPPVRWLIGFDSYKLGSASTATVLKNLLGVEAESYRQEMAGGASGCPSVIRVKHSLATSEAMWSSIFMFPYDGVLPRSMELDGYWLDEPPPVQYLEAVRSRVGMRPLRRLITATPLDAMKWRPIKDQYPPEENEVEGGRVRVRWSVFDNEALPDWVKEDLTRAAEGQVHEKAKLYGHHVDAKGECPWAADLLDRWTARTSQGVFLRVTATDERDTVKGREKYQVTKTCEVWQDPQPNQRYLVVADASSGIKSNEHDPGGVHVWEVDSRKLVARFGQMRGSHDPWNGYIGAYGLGWIAATLAKKYSSGGVAAVVAPEGNAWAGPMLTALADARHFNIFRDDKVDRPGQEGMRLGFVNSDATRPLFIGALENAMARDDVVIQSPEVVQCMRDCIIDRNGKIVAGPGYHDEDMILAGAALHIIHRRFPSTRPRLSPKETLIQQLTGRTRPPRFQPRAPARLKWSH